MSCFSNKVETIYITLGSRCHAYLLALWLINTKLKSVDSYNNLKSISYLAEAILIVFITMTVIEMAHWCLDSVKCRLWDGISAWTPDHTWGSIKFEMFGIFPRLEHVCVFPIYFRHSARVCECKYPTPRALKSRAIHATREHARCQSECADEA